MLEMARSRESHGETMFISGGDHLVVADGAARLDYGRNPMTRRFVDTITKREERIGSEHRSRNRQSRSHRADLY
jgi:hypothetical protein